MRLHHLLIPAALFALAACAGAQTTDSGEPGRDRILRGADRYPNEGLIIVKADLNRDNIPDVYTVYREVADESDPKAPPTRKIVRKEVDVNFDGSIDIWRHYSEAEKLQREEFDYNFDGRVDAVNTYDLGSLVKKEMDVEFDQAPDVFKFYKEGELVRIERDTDNNGEIDYWEFYERGVLDRIGTDTTGDGKADTWQNR